MPSKQISALVLPAEKVASTEPQALPSVPGLWVPGVAYSPAVLGVSLKDARKMIEDYGLPLEIVTVDEKDVAEMFAPAVNHAPSGHMDVDAERLSEAKTRAPDPIVTDSGQVIVPPTPAPNTASDWAEGQRAEATRLANGEVQLVDTRMSPLVAGAAAAGGGMMTPLTPFEDLDHVEAAAESTSDADEPKGGPS